MTQESMIRQPDNISLDSHRETTETQTFDTRPCVRVTLRVLGRFGLEVYSFTFGQT